MQFNSQVRVLPGNLADEVIQGIFGMVACTDDLGSAISRFTPRPDLVDGCRLDILQFCSGCAELTRERGFFIRESFVDLIADRLVEVEPLIPAKAHFFR